MLQEQHEMDKEKDLWSLLLLLYMDEQNLKAENENENFEDVENFESINEQTIARNLEKSYPLLRRIRLVIEWLEKIARESNYLKSIKENLSSFSEKCTNWEHTLHYLKNATSFTKKDKLQHHSNREFVTELVRD
jgi:hypothetical protein